MSVITLTTDFGYRDWFAGVMKGIILGLQPAAQVIDITHEIPAGDITAGAFALWMASPYFPPGSIHVAVVDPGVGSHRAALVFQTGLGYYIGPDNGVLSWAVKDQSIISVRRLENRRYFRATLSNTFHGRDLFAPVAAHLAAGVALAELGPEATNWQTLPWPKVIQEADAIRGKILYFDHFGNAITNIPADDVQALGPGRKEVCCPGRLRCPVAAYYQEVDAGEPLGLIGSGNLLEISLNGGSAMARFELVRDLEIVVQRVI